MSRCDYEALCEQIAPAFAEVPGLLSKPWIVDPDSNVAGGVYRWADRAACDAYVEGELFAGVRANPALANLRSRRYDVLAGPTRVTRGLDAALACATRSSPRSGRCSTRTARSSRWCTGSRAWGSRRSCARGPRPERGHPRRPARRRRHRAHRERLRPLGEALGEPVSSLAERLGDGPTVLVVDVLERLRLLDDWLRVRFLPALPASVRVVLAGRDPLPAAWAATFGELLAELRSSGAPRAPCWRRCSEDGEDAWRRLDALPFVDTAPDGLRLHETFRARRWTRPCARPTPSGGAACAPPLSRSCAPRRRRPGRPSCGVPPRTPSS